jgi:MOSC domain-containing protein YiiM
MADLERPAMKLVSVNVGLPREVIWEGKAVRTGIFKEPASGRVALRKLNLDGDGQADLSAHGGPDKAIYAYPAEHYDIWRAELPGISLPWGAFGENLTTEGLREEEVNIGDQLRIGSAVVMVTQPRRPCYKLAMRLGRPDIADRFLSSGRSGFYLAVLQEGEIEAGEAIEVLRRDENAVTVADINHLHAQDMHNLDLLRRAAQVGALPPNLRSRFLQQIAELTHTP